MGGFPAGRLRSAVRLGGEIGPYLKGVGSRTPQTLVADRDDYDIVGKLSKFPLKNHRQCDIVALVLPLADRASTP